MANSADPDQFRSQLIWSYSVCKDRVYPGSAGQGLNFVESMNECYEGTIQHCLVFKLRLFQRYFVAFALSIQIDRSVQARSD